MRTFKQASWALVLFTVGGLTTTLHAQTNQMARLHAALMSPERPEADKAKDAARKPAEVVEALGIKDGMTALDIFAFGGWYTRVLSAAVGPTGKVYSQNPAFLVNRPGFMDQESELVESLGNVEPLHGDIAGIDGKIDVALTNQNLHDVYNNGGEEGALALLKSVYTALKPGGVFGVIDHQGMPGNNDLNKQNHRMDVAVAKDLLVKAGFTIEAESSLLHNPADDHMHGTMDESLHGNSDRFFLKARKPR
jgi:predicted methyltransferase